MERLLEIYHDGRLYEIENHQAVKVTETQGQVAALIEALKFSTAKTFTVAPPDQPFPHVASRRGAKQINAAGFQLLKTFEGCQLNAYDDGAGVWTIGYGHTSGVSSGMSIDQTTAEEWLRQDLEKFEAYVEDAVQVQLNDNQFSALVCFCFNVGPGAGGFGDSTLLKRLNEGNYQAAANQFPVWNKVNGQPWLGLTRRRLAEQALFLGQSWQPFLNAQDNTATTDRSLQLTEPLMQGEDVRCLQTALQKAGININPDGFFGKETDQAVRKFQQNAGLTADGIVGSETRQKLDV